MFRSIVAIVAIAVGVANWWGGNTDFFVYEGVGAVVFGMLFLKQMDNNPFFGWSVFLFASIILILSGIGEFLLHRSDPPPFDSVFTMASGEVVVSLVIGSGMLAFALFAFGSDLYSDWQRSLETSRLPKQTTEIIMGDVFKNIQGSTVINKSSLKDSIISVQKIDPQIGEALGRVALVVHQSGNREAGELFQQFTEELCKSEPRKSVLRTCWTAVQNALPAVTAIAEATGAISKLFT